MGGLSWQWSLKTGFTVVAYADCRWCYSPYNYTSVGSIVIGDVSVFVLCAWLDTVAMCSEKKFLGENFH